MKILSETLKKQAVGMRVTKISAGNLRYSERVLRDYTWSSLFGYNSVRDDEIVQQYMEEHVKIAIGSILGDGSLKYLYKRTQTSQIYVSQHSSKLQYLEWLHSKLGKGFGMNPIRPKKGYKQYYFISKQDKLLGLFKKSFYPRGKKVIPSNISELLKNEISLAVWYMDDGTLDKRYKYHFNASIATYGFGFDECEVLSKVILDNFSLSTSVNHTKMRGKVYPRLYVKSESMDRFISLIKPFIHPVFYYKIGLD